MRTTARSGTAGRGAAVLFASLAWAAGAAAAETDEARALLEAGKYDEVDEVLGRILAQREPPLEALRVSLDAAVAGGRVVTAQRRVTALLQRTQTPEILFLGGQVAARAGDANLALTRFLMFARSRTDKSRELRAALSYLMREGFHPEALKKYVRVFGADGTAYAHGTALLGRLLQEGDTEKCLDVARDLLEHCTDREHVLGIHSLLRQEAERGGIDYEAKDAYARVIGVMLAFKVKAKTIDTGHLQYVYERWRDTLSPAQLVDFFFRIQSLSAGPLGGDVPLRAIGMRHLGTEAARIEAGRRFLALERLYAESPNPWHYEQFMTVLEECPQAFAVKGRELVSAGKIQTRFERLKRRMEQQPWSPHRHIERIARHYLAGDRAATIAFYRKHIAIIDQDRFRNLVELTQGKDLDGLLRAAAEVRSYKDVIDLRICVLDWFEGQKNKRALSGAASEYMRAYAGSFNWKHIYRHVARSSLLSADEKIDLLQDVARKGGRSGPLGELVKRIAAEKSDQRVKLVSGSPRFRGLTEELEQNKPGSDLVTRTHVALNNMPENRRHPSDAVHKLCRDFLEVYRKRVPGGWDRTRSVEEVAACGIFEKHGRHVWDNSNAVFAWAQLWAPRLGPGFGWGWMLRIFRERRGGHERLHAIAPHYLALMKGKEAGSPAAWNELTNTINPKTTWKSVFAGFEDKAGAGNVLHYLSRQDWHPQMQGIMDDMAGVVARPGFKFDGPHRARELIHFLFRHTGPQSKPPVGLTRALWGYYLGEQKKGGWYDLATEAYVYGQYAKAGRAKEAAGHLGRYLQEIGTRTLREQIDAAAAVCRYVPREGGTKPERGGRLHTELEFLKPLYERIPEKDWPEYTLHGHTVADMTHVAERFPEGPKRDARRFLRLMVDMLVAGARFDRGEQRGRVFLSMVAGRLREAIEQAEWDDVSRLAMLYARSLRVEEEWQNNFGTLVLPLVEKLVEKGAHELAYVFVTEVKLRNGPGEGLAKQLAMMKSNLARDIPDLLAVDRSDPSFELHMGAQALALGNEARAWKLTSAKLALLPEVWTTLDPCYVAWCVEQMRKQKLLKQGLELAFTMLVREFDLAPEVAAKVSLAKGDIYRDMHNYQAARIEYEGLKNNMRYSKTESGLSAKYRLIGLLTLTKDYTAAESLLERLVDSDDVRTQAEAYYLYAKMAFDQAEYKEARDHLTAAFKRRHDHVEGRLLEGELKLLLPRGLASTEVLVGNPKLKTVAIPGRPLTLKLQDSNLSIARGGAAVPVVVTTSKGLDEEHVKLFPSASDRYLFAGTISTALGEARRGNCQLELLGDDTVSYVIDPEFQKANGISYPPKFLTVKSDARLVASAGEILSEEAAEKRELERRLGGVRGRESRRFEGRTGRTVRPGSFIYFQVTDFDRDVSGEEDKVTVDLKTTSGDVLSGFVLVETGRHTGVFRGKVPTGVPFPKASASDTEEGRDASVLVNSRKDGSWTSLADGRKPKWVEVDTMSSHSVKAVSLRMPEPGRVKQIILYGSLASGEEELASLPQRFAGGMGLSGKYYQGLNFNRHRATRVDARVDFGARGGRGLPKGMSGQNLSVSWTGTVEPRHSETYTFHTVSDDGVRLWVDGKKVVENWSHHGATEDTGRIALEAARRYSLKLEFFQGGGPWAIKLLWSSKSQQKEIVPPSALRPFAGAVDLQEPVGSITKTDTGFRATLARPKRLRRLRWVFEEFDGNSVSATKIEVRKDSGEAVIPVSVDFTAGTTNSTLEISPGDEIEATYNDEKRTRRDTPALHAKLDSSYFNGAITLANEVIEDREGGRWIRYQPAMRCRTGDQVMIVVRDYDEDLTDERDTVPVTVRTAGAERIRLKALETWVNGQEQQHAHSGVFLAVLRMGDATGPGRVRLLPGETVTVSYLDKENTDPGVPVERECSIDEAGRSRPELAVYRTSVKLVEDKSREAQAKLTRMRMRGRQTEGMVVYREQIVARHPGFRPEGATDTPGEAGVRQRPATTTAGEIAVSVNAPLLFELSYPKMALHSGSLFHVTATAESEIKAAAEEGRKPSSLQVPTYVKGAATIARDMGYEVQLQSETHRDSEQMLRDGLFAGIIRLQLGSPGDSVNDLVVAGPKEFTGQRREERQGYGYRVPTLIVSGSDVVRISVKDEDAGGALTAKLRLLSDARLELLDSTYTARNEAIHLGEKFCVRITDPDHDRTDGRDRVAARVTSESGDSLRLELTETLPHSGVFTGTVCPEFLGERPAGVRARTDAGDGRLCVNFGDEVVFTYTDNASLASARPVDVVKKGKIRFGFDGELAAFTKRFKDPEMAVKTRFLMAEALFEMAKEHRKLDQPERAEEEIGTGKRILEEAMRDYPDTTLVAQGDFLLANLAQELGRYQEAVGRYSNIISNWPDSEYAARSQFKKAICLEKLGNYDQACEEYVRLTYIYPDSGLVADATVRLGNYYYKQKSYKVAGRIFFRFQQKHPAHALAPKALFLSAHCYMKMEEFGEAIRKYAMLVGDYPDEKEVRSEAMYWLADAYFKNRQYDKAYQTFKKLTWDYPETKWAKIARGRLTEDVLARFDEQ